MRRFTNPKSDLEIVAEFTAAQAVPGARLNIDWENVEPKIAGLPKLLRGLILALTVVVDTDATGMPAAMQGKRLFDAISSLRFAIDGHDLIPDGIGGLRLHHDAVRMFGFAPLGEPTDTADATASDVTQTVYLYVPFAHPNAAPGAELDGAIPIAALRREDMRLQLSSGDLGGFPGVTLKSAAMTIYADYVVHHKLLVPPKPELRLVTEARTEFHITPSPGYLYYADVFDTEEAAGWDFDHSDYERIQLFIGSGRHEQWEDPTIPAQAHNLRARLQDLGAPTLTVANPEFIPLIAELRRSGGGSGLASKQPMGPLRLKIGARQSHDSTTVQYRLRGTRTDAWRASMYKRLGVPAGAELGVDHIAARGGRVPEHLLPHLPESLVWRDMPFEEVVRQNRDKFPRVFGG